MFFYGSHKEEYCMFILSLNRPVKLFSGSCYNYLKREQSDLDTFPNQTKDQLPDILKNFNEE
jgi:hypothetical protein